MELYAISLFKFDWPIAAMAPNIIEAIEINTIIVCHWSIKFINGVNKNLINTVKAAIFGKAAKNNVTEVGEPWYTSGAHIWKGTADILNANPTIKKTKPKITPYSIFVDVFAMSIKFVEPENPYTSEHR